TSAPVRVVPVIVIPALVIDCRCATKRAEASAFATASGRGITMMVLVGAASLRTTHSAAMSSAPNINTSRTVRLGRVAPTRMGRGEGRFRNLTIADSVLAGASIIAGGRGAGAPKPIGAVATGINGAASSCVLAQPHAAARL